MLLSPELMCIVKNYLDITWEDKAADVKLEDMIKRNMVAIDRVGGRAFDYESELKAQELLLNRIMYERSGALDDFSRNYASDLLELQLDERVARYAEDQEATISNF